MWRIATENFYSPFIFMSQHPVVHISFILSGLSVMVMKNFLHISDAIIHQEGTELPEYEKLSAWLVWMHIVCLVIHIMYEISCLNNYIMISSIFIAFKCFLYFGAMIAVQAFVLSSAGSKSDTSDISWADKYFN
jgi:hypothetical protein